MAKRWERSGAYVAVGLACVFAGWLVAATDVVHMLVVGAACVTGFLAGRAVVRRARSRRTVRKAEASVSLLRHERLLVWALPTFLPLYVLIIAGGKHRLVFPLVAVSVAPLMVSLAAHTKSQWRIPWTLVAFISLAFVAWYRDGNKTSMLYGGCIMCLILAMTRVRPSAMPRVVEAVVNAGIATLLLNVLAHFVGIAGVSASSWKVDSGASGAGGSRVFFPYAFGLNTLSSVAAMVIVAVVATGITRRSILFRVWRVAGVLAALYVLQAASSRMPLIAMLIVGAAVYLWPRLGARAATTVVVVALLVMPLWWGTFRSAARPAVSSLVSVRALSRNSSADELMSLQDRVKIWRVVSNATPDTPPKEAAIGWGGKGQVPSGLYQGFRRAVPLLLNDSRNITAHSSFLQVFIEEGVVGVLVLLMLVIAPLRRLRKVADRPEVLAVLAMLAVLVVCASTESMLAPGVPQDPFWLLLLIVGVAGMALPETKKARAGVTELVDA